VGGSGSGIGSGSGSGSGSSILRRTLLAFTVTAVIASMVLFVKSNWQWQRLHVEKRERIFHVYNNHLAA